MRMTLQMFIVGFTYAVASKFDFVQDLTCVLMLIFFVVTIGGPRRK